MKTFTTLVSLLITSLFTFGQTGPGGVGATNGASNLILWMDANTVTGTNGSTITTWNDASGYNHHFAVGNGATFTTPAQNGNAAFTFNSGNQNYFERAYTAALSPTNYTAFSACNVTNSGSYKAIYSNRDDNGAGSTAGYILYAGPTTDDWSFWTGSTGNSWDQIFSGESTTGNWASQRISYDNTSNTKELTINQGNVYTNTGVTNTPNAAQPMRIGAGNNESIPDFYFDGQIGEIILYNTVLNSTEQLIVQNYLSAKYDFALDNNDLYVQDNAANGNYDYDVAGIGRVSATNLHNDSKGSGIVHILNATNLDDNEFLLWGHDGGQQEAKNTTDIPAGVAARFYRVWRVNEVDASGAAVNVGNIDMQWDLNNLGPVTASDLRLLIDTDNDGLFSDETPISGAVSLGGGIFSFNGVSAIANNLRFTLATINTAQTPLPVTLTSFTVQAINNSKVLINWQTAMQINSKSFTVERSIDNTNWESLKTIAGAGNSNTPMSYSVTDEFPYKGVSFYRLKLTDINGVSTYSTIKIVNLKKAGDINIVVYPNPSTGKFIIQADEDELKQVKIFSMLGQDVTQLVKITKVGAAQLNLDMSLLKSGMYVLKTKSNTQQITKQ